jgi:hypothetical protein
MMNEQLKRDILASISAGIDLPALATQRAELCTKIQRYLEFGFSGFLFLSGHPGTGKTHTLRHALSTVPRITNLDTLKYTEGTTEFCGKLFEPPSCPPQLASQFRPALSSQAGTSTVFQLSQQTAISSNSTFRATQSTISKGCSSMRLCSPLLLMTPQ